MTCEEKYKREHVGSTGVSINSPGCPQDHGYLPAPDNCPWPYRHAAVCMDCWNREIPEKNEKEKENMNETEWTRTEVKAEAEAPKELTVAEIEDMMYELDRNYLKAMDELRVSLKEARRREEMQEIANRAKMILDSYISAGFTREEALEFIRSSM